jgi:hypothetical protein
MLLFVRKVYGGEIVRKPGPIISQNFPVKKSGLQHNKYTYVHCCLSIGIFVKAHHMHI